MELQDQIVKEARTWIGTPFRHQGRIKGLGVDCANMISQTIIQVVPRYQGRAEAIVNNYRRFENGKLLLKILEEETDFILTEDKGPGDIIALIDEAHMFPKIPRHLVWVDELTPITTFVIDPTSKGVRR